MEDFSKTIKMRVEVERTDWPTKWMDEKEMTFRRRLSGAVFKPLYAALCGNNDVVNDKEKRGHRSP
jgi:hypothetical protein